MTRHVPIIFALFIATLPATAFAGNDDEILIGTQGARLGGAVTATVTDSTALWYNPGAIGRTRWAQFGVTGTLVQARVVNGPSGVSGSEISVIPSTVGHEIPLPNNWAFGYGIFTTQAQDRRLRDSDDDAFLDLLSRRTVNFGAGLGAPITPKLRVGLGVFAVYDSMLYATTIAPNYARDSLGAVASLGLHWAPSADWALGLSINSPRLVVASWFEAATANNETFSASAPFRVRGGIAHDFGWLTVSVDADVQTALTNRDFMIDRDVVPNARLALDFELDPQTRIGIGAFSDLLKGSVTPAQGNMDYFGVAGGIETSTRYQLDPHEPAEAIEISSFIGFRYAFGFGTIPTSDDRATSHEFGINLGSGLRF